MSESVPSVMQSQQIAPSAPIPVRLPNIFAVVCDISNERVYPWGTLRIDDMTHSDFRRLQILVFENSELGSCLPFEFLCVLVTFTSYLVLCFEVPASL